MVRITIANAKVAVKIIMYLGWLHPSADGHGARQVLRETGYFDIVRVPVEIVGTADFSSGGSRVSI